MLDQAEGLRRMFAGDVRRMIGVLSERNSACGQMLSTGLAIALGAAGSKVLLLDENLAAGTSHPLFALDIDYDLFQVLRDQTDMKAALMKVAPGVDILAGGLLQMDGRLAVESQTDFVNAFYRLAGAYDVVLINAAGEGASAYPSLTWAAQDIIVLCGDRMDSVTSAYAYIKTLRQAGERRFHLLFEPMKTARARMLYRNLAMVSRRHLQEFPEDLGMLPAQVTPEFFAMLADSVQGWPLPLHKDGHFRAFMQRLLYREPSYAVHAAVRSG